MLTLQQHKLPKELLVIIMSYLQLGPKFVIILFSLVEESSNTIQLPKITLLVSSEILNYAISLLTTMLDSLNFLY